MNEILQLKGTFEQKKATPPSSLPNIPKNKSITIKHLLDLKNSLEDVRDFWKNEKLKIKPAYTTLM